MYITVVTFIAIALVFLLIGASISFYIVDRQIDKLVEESNYVYVVEEYVEGFKEINSQGFYLTKDQAIEAMKQRILEGVSEEDLKYLHENVITPTFSEYALPETDGCRSCTYWVYKTKLNDPMEG